MPSVCSVVLVVGDEAAEMEDVGAMVEMLLNAVAGNGSVK
jgi:hypothetical protein